MTIPNISVSSSFRSTSMSRAFGLTFEIRRYLFELFLEFFKLAAQTFNLGGQGLNPVFKTNDFFGFARSARLLADRLLTVKFIDFHFTSQQMRKARLFLT